MSAAAVPKYVNDAAGDFTDCPPGHRFNLYFPIWEHDWQIDKNNKANALRKSLKLGGASKLLDALRKRQKYLADSLPGDRRFVMEARSTAPFATGLGLEHPIENGFAFLSPYGLPYLAGSGVKGVLRRAAEELHDSDNAEITNDVINALFGPEDTDNARRGALIFWDTFPVPPNGEMVVEIMTPHFGDYYQGNSSPHDAGKPNPIPFLAVPAGSQFRFVITCEPMLLTNAVPQGEWKALVAKIVEHAFDWLGFGAKTAVGYGAMQPDVEARKRAEADSARREEEARRAEEESKQAVQREAELARLSPIERSIREFLNRRPDRQQPEISAVIGAVKQGCWTGEERIAVARWLQKTMQTTKGQWKETSQAKKPGKDREYQNTLLVKSWLEGK